ncbi:hypothetical protein [Rhodohalobacter sp.]|uniref:hypothetical protein n=1 Tax=Rhodohalobacter sp. TaxID=1974210 RepID=UPI002ACE72E1|nr:hypothetical protein [Rhodohalobacter sp.]MDZ7757638.1 hypothetical protein [Rhodohalobacter sp.]
MKRSFNIELFRKGEEAVCYAVWFNGEQLTEPEKFIDQQSKQEPESFEDSNWRLEYMLEEHLFLPPMLKLEEGKRNDWVVAIKTVKPKQLRWYGLRYNDRILILGNGGIKNADTYQEDPHLYRCVKDLQYVFRCIQKRVRRNEISFDTKINRITGNLNFPLEQFQDIRYPDN